MKQYGVNNKFLFGFSGMGALIFFFFFFGWFHCHLSTTHKNSRNQVSVRSPGEKPIPPRNSSKTMKNEKQAFSNILQMASSTEHYTLKYNHNT
jgi:hypothetical protein